MADGKKGNLVIIGNSCKYKCPKYGVIVDLIKTPNTGWTEIFIVKFPDNDKLFQINFVDLEVVFDETLKKHIKPEKLELKRKIEEWRKLKKLQAEISASSQNG